MLKRFLQKKSKNGLIATNRNPTEYKKATVLFPDITADILLEWGQFPFQGVGKIACQNAVKLPVTSRIIITRIESGSGVVGGFGKEENCETKKGKTE